MPYEVVDNLIEAFYSPAEQINSGAVGVETPEAAGVSSSQMTSLETPEFGAAPGQQMPQLGKISAKRQAVIDYAKTLLGVPYVWGGTSNRGVDCSGLIQLVLKNAAGIRAPRISFQQAQMGKRVSINQLQPGDLVAWDNSARNNGADHIAFYIGDGMILEAPRTGLTVRIRKLHEDEGAWGVALNYGD